MGEDDLVPCCVSVVVNPPALNSGSSGRPQKPTSFSDLSAQGGSGLRRDDKRQREHEQAEPRYSDLMS